MQWEKEENFQELTVREQERERVKQSFAPLLFTDVDDDDNGVFDPNMENVFEIPLKLLFMKFAVACDEDENSDDVADDDADAVVVTVVVEKFLLAIGVGVTDTLAEMAVGAVAVASVAIVGYPLVIILLLLRALVFGSTDVAIDLLTNGAAVLYGVGVWSPNVKWSVVDAANKLVCSPPYMSLATDVVAVVVDDIIIVAVVVVVIVVP